MLKTLCAENNKTEIIYEKSRQPYSRRDYREHYYKECLAKKKLF